MSEQSKTAIVTFRMQHDEFSFIGKEYPFETSDMGELWNDFGNSGGWDIVDKYHKKPYSSMMVAWYNTNPAYETYSPGTITECETDAPKGFTLMKFPSSEYLVITTQWQSAHDEMYRENGGHPLCWSYLNSVQMPDGYARCRGTGSPINLIEAENCDEQNGFRYELWVPIKKLTDKLSF